jgi:glycerol-3-phosphate dehydrogenase
MDRRASLARLRTENFDLLVVGGGITGCGIALDAAARGLRTALIERGDFACGTSSRSSKLIHGGLRYLRNLQFKVTLEASREKSLLKRLAPHLVEDLPFVLPFWSRAARAALASGLWIYDAAAGFPKGLIHRHLDARQTREAIPGIRSEGLRGAYVYYDARADDCRLVLHVAKKASDLGAVLANYVEATGFLKENGRIVGVRTRDFDIAASRVVNATGVWCDELRSADDPGEPRAVRPSKGVHLVVPARRLGLSGAVTLPAPEEGRVVFLIPWGDSAIVGTTDTDYTGPLDRPRAEPEDMAYLLERVNAFLPSVRLGAEDIRSTYAGLRPLLLDDGSSSPSRVPREHRIFESPSGLLSVTGGKLTTYRRMAKEVVDAITDRPCRTADIDLFASEAQDPLARFYGSEASRIVDRAPLLDGLPHVWGEVDYALEREMALTLTDVLARRMRLALYAPDQGRSVAHVVAQRMGARLGWDGAEVRRQVEAYERELEESYRRGF